MKILITGNMGYVGSVLAEKIALQNIDNKLELVGFDSGLFGHKLTVSNLLPEAYLNQQIYKDMRDISSADLKDVDVVIHLAALSNDPMGNKFAALTKEINLYASQRLADLCLSSGVKKLVFASSCSVYGEGGNASKDENSEVAPLTPYAESKIEFENYLREKSCDTFQAICLRFSTACGSSPRLRLDLVLNDFVFNALTSGRIEVLSDGSPVRPLIDVSDMANALIWASLSEIDGSFVVLNTGMLDCNYTVKEIAEKVIEELPHVELDINHDAPEDKRSYRVNFNKFNDLSGGQVLKVDLTSSIRSLISSIGGQMLEERKENYFRLKTLNDLLHTGEIDSQLFKRRER